MASAAQVAANQANAKLSSGAKSARGRTISSMNALKHGRRSKKIRQMRDDSYSFQERLRKWKSSGDAQSDVEEFLMYRNVCLSFELDRAEQQRVARCETLIENSDEDEFAAIEAIGKRLFFDPVGPTPLYGNRPYYRKTGTSWNGKALDENDPAVLVKLLERSEAGCCWLLDQFQELRSLLESLGFWQPHDRLKFIRLLGRQPVEANEDDRVAQVFLACHALHKDGETAFDDLLTDMSEMQRDVYREALQVRWPKLYCARPIPKWRKLLFDLVDESIERIHALLEEHQQNADVVFERTYARLSFDPSPEGEALRNYLLKCTNALHRGLASYRRYKERRVTLPPWNSPVWDAIERLGDDTPDPAEPIAGATDAAEIDLMKDGESAAAIDSVGSNSRADLVAPASAGNPADGCNPPELSDGVYDAAKAAANPSGVSDEDVAGNDGDHANDNAEIPGTMTNEPNFVEPAVANQDQVLFEVTANLGVESGLDKMQETPAGISEREWQELAPEPENLRAEVPDRNDPADPETWPARLSKWARTRFPDEKDRRAAERMLEEILNLDRSLVPLFFTGLRACSRGAPGALGFSPRSP